MRAGKALISFEKRVLHPFSPDSLHLSTKQPQTHSGSCICDLPEACGPSPLSDRLPGRVSGPFRAILGHEKHMYWTVQPDSPDLSTNQPLIHLDSLVHDLPDVCGHFPLSDRHPGSVSGPFRAILGLENHM